MGAIIGETFRYNTWLSLRSVFAPEQLAINVNQSRVFFAASESNRFLSYKSASPGSGLIKADSVTLAGDTTSNFRPIRANETANPSPPPDYLYDYGIELNWFISGQSQVPNEVRDILIGKTVTMEDSTSFEINSDLFDPAKLCTQIYALARDTDPGELMSIDSLEQIS